MRDRTFGSSLRRRLSGLLAGVLVGGLFVGLSTTPAAAVDDKVIVTFTFDDGGSSQYPMLPVFAAHDAKATFYVNSGHVGTNGHLSWAQLHDIADAGHEIGGHTAHHTELTEVDEATAREEIQADITTLQAQGFPRPVSFAYPVGFYGPTEEAMVEEAGYASARTIDTFRHETDPPADPYAIRIVRDSLDGSEGLQALKNDVLSAESTSGKTWIVYVMHDFYSPIDDEIGEFLDWLQPRAASGTVVKTVREVVPPPGPQPPVAEAGPAQSVVTGSTVTLDGSGSSDVNNDPLSYQWTQTGGPAVTLSSATAATPTFTAPGTPATLAFQLTVNDGQASSQPDTVAITVAEPSIGTPEYRSSSSSGNDAWASAVNVPVPAGATTGDIVVVAVGTWGVGAPAVTVPAGFTLKATHTGSDNGGAADTVRIYWKRLTGPDTASYRFTWSGGRWSSGHAIAVSGAATSGDPVEALDHASASSTTFPSATVTTATTPLLAWFGRNDEPTSQHTPPTGFSEVQDKDSSTLAYRQPSVPGTHTASGASYTGSGWPLQAVLVAIRDDAPTSNRPPVAEAGPAQSVVAGSTVTLDGSGSSDPDNDALSYQWTQTGGPVVALSSATAAKPTFTAPATASTLTFGLTVNDGQASSTADTVAITVTAPPPTNAPPVAEAGPAQSVVAGSTVTLDGSGSSDPDNDALSYQWTQTGGPVVALSSATAAKPTFTAPATASTLTFGLTVNDGQASSTADTVAITVTAPPPTNAPPVAEAGPAQSVVAGSTVTLDGSGSSDPDNDALSYQWTQTGGPVVALSSATAAKPTFTAPATASTLTFGLTVNDGQASSTADTVAITVTAPPPTNAPPVAEAGPAQSVVAGSTVTLDGSGSSDPDNDALSYQWTQTGGPVVALSSATAAKPTFTAPATASTLTFGLTVNDGQASSTADTVAITVTAPPTGTPTYRSSSSSGNDAWASAVNVPVPAGATTGDIVVLSVGTWGVGAPAVTAPAGFTLKATHTGFDNGGAADTVRIYWKRLTGSDTGRYRFTWSGKRWSAGTAIAVSGAASSGDPVEALNHASSAAANTFPTTSVTTASTPLLAWFGRNDEPTSQHTPPTGFTEVQDRDSSTLAYQQPTVPGTHTASGATYTGTARPLQAVLVAIKP